MTVSAVPPRSAVTGSPAAAVPSAAAVVTPQAMPASEAAAAPGAAETLPQQPPARPAVTAESRASAHQRHHFDVRAQHFRRVSESNLPAVPGAGAGAAGGGGVVVVPAADARLQDLQERYGGPGWTPGNTTATLRMLKDFHQSDGLKHTQYDEVRCTCQTAVASAMLGGKDSMLRLLKHAKEQVTANRHADPSQRTQHHTRMLETMEDLIRTGKPVPRDMLHTLSDVLYHYQAEGESTSSALLHERNVGRMLEVVAGARPGTARTTTAQTGSDGHEAREKLVTETARAWPAGTRYMIPACRQDFNAHGAQTSKPDHVIMAWRDGSGKLNVYDPGAKPCHMEGDVALKHLAYRLPDQGREAPQMVCARA